MDLLVVRHGQTVENRDGIIQGQSPGHLSPLGIEQAQNTAIQLSQEHIDAIYSSDLGRCRDTASPISRYHADTPLYFDAALRELSFGEFQGKASSTLDWSALAGTILTRKVPGGESWTDLNRRVGSFLNTIFKQHTQDKVLLVTHGGPMRVIRSYLGNTALEDLLAEPIPNCAMWRFTMSKWLA